MAILQRFADAPLFLNHLWTTSQITGDGAPSRGLALLVLCSLFP